MYFSYHTHSTFCDGKASVEDVCQSALAAGLKAVGFSSHAPVMFPAQWAMPFERLEAYVEEIERCRNKYAGKLDIYRSLETDFIANDRSIPFDVYRRLAKLDYIIGSVHLVASRDTNELWFLDGPAENYEKGVTNCFSGNIQKAVTAYYKQIQEMVISQNPDVIAHIDKVIMNNKGRYFSGEEQWYKDIVEETLQAVAKSDAIIEVNTRGIYRGKYHTWFPCKEIIQRCVELDIPLTVSVDAHHPDELRAGFDEALQAIFNAGAQVISIFEGGLWKQKALRDVMSKIKE